MLPFGVTIPATVPQGSEIPEGLMNNPVYKSARNDSKCANCGQRSHLVMYGIKPKQQWHAELVTKNTNSEK